MGKFNPFKHLRKVTQELERAVKEYEKAEAELIKRAEELEEIYSYYKRVVGGVDECTKAIVERAKKVKNLLTKEVVEVKKVVTTG